MAMICELLSVASAANTNEALVRFKKISLHQKNMKKWVRAQAKHFGVSKPVMMRLVRYMNLSSYERPQNLSHISWAFRDSGYGFLTRREILKNVIERWIRKGYVAHKVKNLDGVEMKGFITTRKGWWPEKEQIFKDNHVSWDCTISEKVTINGGYYVQKVNRHLDKCLETKHLEEGVDLQWCGAIPDWLWDDFQYRLDNNISDYTLDIYTQVDNETWNNTIFTAKSSDDTRGRSYKIHPQQDIIGDKVLRYNVKSPYIDYIDPDKVEPI